MVERPARPTVIVHWNVEQFLVDMKLRGWNDVALAREAGVVAVTVHRFMRGERQTPKTAAKLAEALGHAVDRYLSHVEVAGRPADATQHPADTVTP